MQLPPCGLYRTLAQIGSVPEGRLVYFHNHGEPGAGMYLPASWQHNRAKFSSQGNLLPGPEFVSKLEPLPNEGFYRVTQAFHCCAKNCREFQPEMLVQLGFNGAGQAILFLPELIDGMMAVPESGTPIDGSRLQHLKALKVKTSRKADKPAS